MFNIIIFYYKYIKEIKQKDFNNLLKIKIKKIIFYHDCRKDKEAEPKKNRQNISKINILLDLFFLF